MNECYMESRQQYKSYRFIDIKGFTRNRPNEFQ